MPLPTIFSPQSNRNDKNDGTCHTPGAVLSSIHALSSRIFSKTYEAENTLRRRRRRLREVEVTGSRRQGAQARHGPSRPSRSGLPDSTRGLEGRHTCEQLSARSLLSIGRYRDLRSSPRSQGASSLEGKHRDEADAREVTGAGRTKGLYLHTARRLPNHRSLP